MALSLKDGEVIRRLASLLRNNGEKILSGACSLALTTSSLQLLNEGFSQIIQNDLEVSFEVLPQQNIPTPTMQDLVLLHDFVQKTASLKVVHGYTNIKGRVSISLFRGLQTLEIKKIPIHLVEGLHKLRSKVKTIICSRCLQNLQDLFESCGGDQSSPMSWSELRSLCLSHNTIQQLDASLRLLPMVDALDLSHNNITKTESYMEYLTELHHLNMGFNKIQSIPTLAISAKSKLRVIILKHNRLENLNGVEELTNLKELNVAYNCMIDHQVLKALHKLHRLTTLTLEGNPLYYHKNHRRLTLENLSRKALPKLTVDGVAVKKSEINEVMKIYSVRRPRPLVAQNHISNVLNEQSANESTSGIEESDQLSSAAYSSGSSSRRKKIKGKRSKSIKRVRKPVISDVDTTGEISSLEGSSVHSPSAFDHLKTRQEMETIRNQLGPDWLTSLAAKRNLSATYDSAKLGRDETDDSVNTNTNVKKSNDQKTPNTMESVEAMHRKAEDQHTDQAACGSSLRVTSALDVNNADDEPYEKVVFQISDSVDTDTVDEQIMKSWMTQRADRMRDSDEVKVTSTEIKVTNAEVNMIVDEVKILEADPQMRDEFDQHNGQLDLVRRDSSEEACQTNDDESEPLIVMCEQDHAQPRLIITVGKRFLHEKDLNGKPIENLDLKCLQGLEKVKGEDGNADCCLPLLELQFDYIRKDRRVRRYVMEDEESAKTLSDLLHRFIAARRMAAHYRDMMQCLKCGHQFRHIANKASKSQLEEESICTCPECESRMVIELDWNSSDHPDKALTDSPIGSSSFQPPVTSSNPQSPYKSIDMNSMDMEKYYSITNVTASYKSLNNSTSDSFRSLVEYDSKLDSSHSRHDTIDSSSVGSEHTLIVNSLDVKNNSEKNHFGRQVSLGFDINVDDTENSLQQAIDTVLPAVKQRDSVEGVHRRHSKMSMRSRKESTDSDILILKSCPNETEASESDITVMSNPSQSSIAVISTNSQERALVSRNLFFGQSDEGLECVQDNGDRPGMKTIVESSPAGSLTSSTLSSMVSSVYEKSIYDNKNQGITSEQEASLCTQNHGTAHDEETESGINRISSTGSYMSNGISSFDSNIHRISSNSSQIDTFGLVYSQNKIMTDITRTDSANSFQKSGSSNSLSTNSSYQTSFGDKSCDNELTASAYLASISFDYEDFSHIDHRLKLHLVMKLLSNNEDLHLLLKCSIIHHQKREDFIGLLVVSSKRFYILKVSSKESSTQLDRWLRCIDKPLITDLLRIRVGFGGQLFHMDFPSVTVSFIVRDVIRCTNFIQALSDHLEQFRSTKSKNNYEGIRRQSVSKLAEIWPESTSLTQNEEQTLSPDILLFTMAFIRTVANLSTVDNMQAVSVIVTPSHLFLLDENHLVPLSKTAAATASNRNEHFMLRDQQKLNNIAYVDVFTHSPLDVRIVFFNEDTSSEESWTLTMETEQSCASLLMSIKEPWRTEFGIDLMINTNTI